MLNLFIFKNKIVIFKLNKLDKQLSTKKCCKRKFNLQSTYYQYGNTLYTMFLIVDFGYWSVPSNDPNCKLRVLHFKIALPAICILWRWYYSRTEGRREEETTCNKCWTVLRRYKNQTRHLGFCKVSSFRVRPIKKEKLVG